jgi:predicted membrane channel-forming protein YqfA (hemolysin III family)
MKKSILKYSEYNFFAHVDYLIRKTLFGVFVFAAGIIFSASAAIVFVVALATLEPSTQEIVVPIMFVISLFSLFLAVHAGEICERLE